MATFFEEVTKAVSQTACAIIAVNDSINGFLSEVGVPGSSAFADRTRALRRQLCNNSDDTVPVPPPPFTGGQCTTSYRVVIRRDRFPFTSGCGQFTQNNVQSSPGTILQGPISGIFARFTGASASCGGLRTVEYVVQTATGEVVVQTETETRGWWKLNEVRIETVIRVDGQPDNCGDPPGTSPPPYSPSPTTVNIEYQNDENITVNEDIDLTIFAPKLSLIGGIFAPITISGNNFNLVGTVELTPEFKLEVNPEINFGSGGSVDNPSAEPVEPTPEPPRTNDRRVIIGAIVTTTSLQNTPTTQIGQGSNPDIFVPRLGSLSFYISTENATAWTNDIDIKNLRCYVPCPAPGGAIDLAASPSSGVVFDVQPVWGYPNQNLAV